MPLQASSLSRQTVELRGAPCALLDRLRTATRPRCVVEIALSGPRGTGKSKGVGHVLWWLAETWPGIQMLVVRKTRTSLTDSFLKTWEMDVVPPGHPVLLGPTRAQRHEYRWPARGGRQSVLATGGLDNPTKLYSTDWDVVAVEEAREVTRDDWAQFRGPLRRWTGDIPIQLLVGMTNPHFPTHWLNIDCNKGLIQRLWSHHEENPRYYDSKTQSWTEVGRAYLDSLDKLPGVLKDWLRYGLWKASPAAVWSNFAEERHLRDLPELDDEERERGISAYQKLGIRWYFGSVDWGWNHAGCLQVWGVDGEERAYRVAEVYRTGKLLEWWVEVAAALREEFDVRVYVCDPSRPEAIEAFNRRMVRHGEAAIATKADNRKHPTAGGDFGGLDLVRWALEGDEAGKPRAYWIRGALREGRDPVLEAASLPCCSEEEIHGYSFLEDEAGNVTERVDPDCPQDGCDATRYALCFAFGRDLSRREEVQRFKPGTLGAILRHEEVWKKDRRRDRRRRA